MASSNKIYSIGSSGDLESYQDFKELLRVLKIISAKHGLKLQSLENSALKLTGSAEQLALADRLLHELLEGTDLDPAKTAMEGSSEHLENEDPLYIRGDHDGDGSEKDEIPRLEQIDRSGEGSKTISNIVQKDTSPREEPQAQLQKSDFHGSEKAEAVLSTMHAFEKPILQDEPLNNDDSSISPLGILLNATVETSDIPVVTESSETAVPIVSQETPVEQAAPNVNPIAANDAAAVNQDAITANIYSTLLSNDVDDEALRIDAIDVTGTTGTVTFNALTQTLTYATGNSFDYLAVGETTTDTFDYTVSDGLGGTDTATVTVTITGVNDGPVGVADSASVNENATTANLHATLLANDTDADTSDTLDISAIDTTGTNGTVAFDGVANSLTYEATAFYDYLAVGETTTDSFVYTVSDGNGGTSDVTVTVTINGVNDVTVAADDADTTDEDTAINGNVFVDNGSGADSDVDTSDTLVVSAVAGGAVGAPVAGSAGGLFTINADGTFSFDPNGEFEGMGDVDTQTTTATYTLSDGNGGTDTATITVTVNGVNDAPTPANDGIYGELDEGGDTIVITEADLLANDTDPEGDGLDITAMVAGAGEGSIVDNGDGTWTYTAPADSLTFTGIATITCTISDGALTTNSTVQLRVFNVLTGDAGNNTLTYQNASTPHKIYGLDGNDTLTGGNARDILIGGDGSDNLIGNDGDDDFIFEGASNGVDTLDGDAGYDRVLGGAGDDTFTVLTFTSISEIDMGAGTDTLLGTAGNDSFYFGSATITDLDIIDGNGGTDTIVGTSGNNTLDLSNVTTITGVDINLGSGNDTVQGSQGADSIIINTGSNSLYGNGGDDTFTIAALSGTNRIEGGAGYDQIIGTAGNDGLTLSVITGIEYIDLGAGTNYISAGYDDNLDFSSFTAGTDMLNVSYLTDYGATGDILNATQGDDEIRIKADGQSDTFYGESGDDDFVLSDGYSGAERIHGGAGYDQIIGSAGDNSIALYALSGIEYIDLGTGTNYISAAYNSDLDFSSFTAGTDMLNVSYFTDYAATGDILTTTQGDDEIRIKADGQTDVFNGEAGDDTFVLSDGYSGRESIHGGAGYDQIIGSAGDNSIVLSAISGIEHIDLGTGTNYIAIATYQDLDFSSFTAGTDILNVSYFTDSSSSGDTLRATQGDDEIRMKADGQSDIFYGEAGDDTFVLSGGTTGRERIYGGTGYDQLLGSASDDALSLYSISGIEYIDLGAGTNYISIATDSDLDFSSYTAGTDMLNVSYLTDASGGDTLRGSQGDDEIRMRADGYSDIFYGEDGDDTFVVSSGVTGSERIYGGAGYDQIIGSAGNDSLVLHTLSGIEHIDLGTGTNYIAAATSRDLDFSSFTAGTDLLNVSYLMDGAGSGTLRGSQGDDVIRIRVDGYSGDVFYGEGGDDTFVFLGTEGATNTIYGGAGTNHLTVIANGTMNISSYAYGVRLFDIDYITDSTGSETLTATNSADDIRVQADSGDDVFNGGGGNDTFIFGGISTGADSFDGGTGTDQLIGSAGDDGLVLASISSIETIDMGTGTDFIQAESGGNLDLSGYTQGVDLLGLEYITDNTGAETVVGTAQDDEIRIQGDANSDVFVGGAGADLFYLGSAKTAADVLSDFDITDNDVINISDVLSYNSGAGDLISDFIQLVDIGDGDPANGAGTVTMQVDVDGTANGVNFVDYFIFADQGMDVADLISGSNLIVE